MVMRIEVENMFIPNGLNLAGDHALIKSMVEYRQVYAMLGSVHLRSSKRLRSQIRRALGAMERELQARSFDPREFTVPAYFQCAKRIVVEATYFQCHSFQSVVHPTDGASAPNLWTFSP